MNLVSGISPANCSAAHSITVADARITPKRSSFVSSFHSFFVAEYRTPAVNPERIPKSLMHTGIWEPFRIMLLSYSWWQKISPIRYGNSVIFQL